MLKARFNSLNDSCHYTEASQLISRPNQLNGFYVMATLAFNELTKPYLLSNDILYTASCFVT